MKDFWDDYKYWIIGVPLVIICLFLAGGIYRVSTGGEFFPDNTESSQAKEARLSRCAEVSGTTPTNQQRLDGDDRGVCSGFTKEEINNAKQKQGE